MVNIRAFVVELDKIYLLDVQVFNATRSRKQQILHLSRTRPSDCAGVICYRK